MALTKLLPNWALWLLIKAVVHTREDISPEEWNVVSGYITELASLGRTKVDGVPKVVAMVGNVGSGKYEAGMLLADKMNAIPIYADGLRVRLTEKVGFFDERVRRMIEEIAHHFVEAGYNIVIISDFVEREKRISLEAILGGLAYDLFFVRTVCSVSLSKQKARKADYSVHPNLFFKTDAVKVKEIERRASLHFNDNLAARKFMDFVDVTIDTGRTKWQEIIPVVISELDRD